MKIIYKIILFSVIYLAVINGQSDIDNAVKYNLELNRKNVHKGEVTTLTANLKILKNYYVYSSHPEKSLSPSYIEWEDSSYFGAVGILQEPKPKTKYDPMFEMDIGYHTGNIQFKQDLKLGDKLKPGSYSMNGTFVYQACDPTKCIPHWDDFTIQLTIDEGEPQAGFILPVQTDFGVVGKTPIAASAVEELDEVIEEGMLSFILFVYFP